MAMFGKDGKPSDVRTPPNDAILSIVAAGMRIIGDLDGPGLLKIDGRVEGSISGPRQVIVGRDGVVQGNVQASEVILAGTVDGSVVSTERVEVQGTAVVNGDIHTRSIVVSEGARINGAVRMGVSGAGDVGDRPTVQVMR
jgi:cytoskeletal protein CcmA (bactofilin family)